MGVCVCMCVCACVCMCTYACVSGSGWVHGKLVDNFSPESDVTSLQDPFMSRPYKTPF